MSKTHIIQLKVCDVVALETQNPVDEIYELMMQCMLSSCAISYLPQVYVMDYGTMQCPLPILPFIVWKRVIKSYVIWSYRNYRLTFILILKVQRKW